MTRPRFDIAGEIGEPSARAADLVEFLKANPGPVDVSINSPGGIAAEGAAIMAALEAHGAAHVRVVGMAASAASLAALGGKTVTMHSAALLMIHDPSASTFGTAEDHRAGADMLDKMTNVYAGAYARATGHSVARIASWMRDETWLTAREALELHFCDAIEADSDGSQMVAAFDYGRFRNAPAELVTLARKNGWATASPVKSKRGQADA